MARPLLWTEDRIAMLRKMFAAGSTDVEIARALKTGPKAVDRVRYRLGLSRLPPRREPPHNFAEVCPTMSVVQLAARYHVTLRVIARWKRTVGVESRPQFVRKSAPLKPVIVTRKITANPWIRNIDLPPREGGRAGDAQLALQRHMAVFRLRVRKPSAPADMWSVGGRVMHENDMIRLAAERYGAQAA